MDESLLKAFFSLAACIVSLLAVYFYAKKHVAKRSIAAGGDAASFSVISRQQLPPKGMMYIVGVGERRLLIGATEQNISLLADITPVENQNADTLLPAVTQQGEKTSLGPLSIRTENLKTLPELDDDPVSFTAFLKTVLTRENSTRK